MTIKGYSRAGFQPGGIFSVSVPDAKATPLGGCAGLSAGPKPQVSFGLEDLTDSASFALAWEDTNRTPVPGMQRPVAGFDPAQNTICLPPGRGRMRVSEDWELVQSSTESHNFDVHQSRFQVQTSAAADSVIAPIGDPAAGSRILQEICQLGGGA